MFKVVGPHKKKTKMPFKRSQIIAEIKGLRFAKVCSVVEQGERHHYYGFADVVNPYTLDKSPVRLFLQRKTKHKGALYVGPIAMKPSRNRPAANDIVVGQIEATEKGKRFVWWWSGEEARCFLHFYHAFLKSAKRRQTMNSIVFYDQVKTKDGGDDWWALYFLLIGKVSEFLKNDFRHPVRKKSVYEHDTGFVLTSSVDDFVYLTAMFARDKEIFLQFKALGGTSSLPPLTFR